MLQNLCCKRTADHKDYNSFIYFKLKNDWIYVLNSKSMSQILPDVNYVSMCLISRSFHPEKCRNMLDILMDQYSKNGDPTKVLEAFLAIHATGKFGLFDSSTYKTDAAMYTHDSVMKELVHTYGVDTCVLWNAMILKKRILVHGDSVEQIIKYVRTLPQLVFQRQDWGMCRPIVNAEPEHLEDLASCGYFVAGTMDNSMVSKTDTYDVILSLLEKRVVVSPHAVDSLKMTSIHRDIANLFNEVTSSDAADKDIIKSLALKTNQIISNLKQCENEETKRISEASINERVSNPGTQQWLLRLAIAEGLV